MEFDPLRNYTREQGSRILYDRLGHEIPTRIDGRDGLGEDQCLEFYLFMIKRLVQHKEITERKGVFSGGNLAVFIHHVSGHVALAEIVRKYLDKDKAQRLCRKEDLRKHLVKYAGYLWVRGDKREEFERGLDAEYENNDR